MRFYAVEMSARRGPARPLSLRSSAAVLRNTAAASLPCPEPGTALLLGTVSLGREQPLIVQRAKWHNCV